jgi:hypothetical protein
VFVLLHAGQTGVERGAQRAAAAVGLRTSGFCTFDQRDEFGRLPPAVARNLMPCTHRGPRASVEANLQIASGLIVLIPDRKRIAENPGMAAALRLARAHRLPHATIDPASNREELYAWMCRLPSTSGSTRILMTGPRGTRWPNGERAAWQLIVGFAQMLGLDHAIGEAHVQPAL